MSSMFARGFCNTLARSLSGSGAAAPAAAAATPCSRFLMVAGLNRLANQGRFFSSSPAGGASNLLSTLKSELQYEKSNYEPADAVTNFPASSGWSLTEKEGDVTMTLKKKVQDLNVTVEFQLVSPTYSGNNEEDEEGQAVEPQETTDFTVTVERPDKKGAIFYCTTVGNDEKYRFIVGNVRYFASEAERNSISAFNGPEFDDLDESLQAGVDEWLASIGINEDLCNFVDAMAVDKEQREYMRWLESIAEVFDSVKINSGNTAKQKN